LWRANWNSPKQNHEESTQVQKNYGRTYVTWSSWHFICSDLSQCWASSC